MAKRTNDIRAGLESELAGLEARLAVLGDRGTEAMKASLQRRIDEVNAALGSKVKGKAEQRPSVAGAEKRPG